MNHYESVEIVGHTQGVHRMEEIPMTTIEQKLEEVATRIGICFVVGSIPGTLARHIENAILEQLKPLIEADEHVVEEARKWAYPAALAVRVADHDEKWGLTT